EKRTTAIANLCQEIIHYKLLALEINTNLTTSKNKKEYFESFFIEEQETKQLSEEELDLYLALFIYKNDSLKTSIPCEEAFSVAAETITKVYSCLFPETA
ncbi:13277_t:CDS:2, partial [Dentiscutata heterogama]